MLLLILFSAKVCSFTISFYIRKLTPLKTSNSNEKKPKPNLKPLTLQVFYKADKTELCSLTLNSQVRV